MIRRSGSSVSILSKRSSAESGIYANSSRSLLRYGFFGCNELKCGSLMTDGQTAGVGDPQSLEIISSCIGSELPWKSVFLAKSSPRMHPTLQMSIDGPYLSERRELELVRKGGNETYCSSPRSNSGGRNQRVMTLFVY